MDTKILELNKLCNKHKVAKNYGGSIAITMSFSDLL